MWCFYWGARLGMSRAEVLHTRIGELFDLVDCHAIANGAKPKAGKMDLHDILMNVR